MNKLIKGKLEIYKKKMLLRIIDKEIKKRKKLYSKFKKQDLIVSKLLVEYQKRYLI